MNKRIKEINELIYLKSKLIKETKKELKALYDERNSLITYERLNSQLKTKKRKK